MNTDNYEFYRASSIGDTLMETLDDLVNAHRISSDQALMILHNFDRVIAQVLSTELKATTMIKGKIKHYNQVEEVWTFVLKTATFMTRENGQKMDQVRVLTAENVTVLSCPSKKKSS